MPELIITGPAGDLEARYTPAASEWGIAILCHPHPQYGGSMDDLVLGAIERALLAEGVSCLRFNFRGVGASDGVYDNGVGEAEDLRAVIEWVTANRPDSRFLLAGYSFGGAVVLAVQAETHCDALILVAPGVGLIGEVHPPATRSLVLLGDADQFFSIDAIRDAFDEQVTRIETLEGADHFSIAMHERLGPLVSEFVRQD